MGGPGSGRWGDYQKRSIVEHSLTLSIEELVRAGLDPTCESSGSISMEAPGGSGAKASLEYRLSPNIDAPLLFYSLDHNGLTGHIRLQKTSPQFGGIRWWLTCPSPSSKWCARRVGKLYLPAGAIYFGCRDCHNLTYWSVQTHDQRVNHYREHPEKLLAVMNAALDPSALSKRKLAFKALRLVK